MEHVGKKSINAIKNLVVANKNITIEAVANIIVTPVTFHKGVVTKDTVVAHQITLFSPAPSKRGKPYILLLVRFKGANEPNATVIVQKRGRGEKKQVRGTGYVGALGWPEG